MKFAFILLLAQESEDLKRFVDYYFDKKIDKIHNPFPHEYSQIKSLKNLLESEIDRSKLSFDDQIDYELLQLILEKKLARYKLEEDGHPIEEFPSLDTSIQIETLGKNPDSVIRKIREHLQTLQFKYVDYEQAAQAQKYLFKLLSDPKLSKMHQEIEKLIMDLDSVILIKKKAKTKSKMDSYKFVVKYQLYLDMTPDELFHIALENFQKTKSLMEFVAKSTDINSTWFDLVEKSKKATWTVNDYYEGAKKLALEARDFALAKDFVTIPKPAQNIRVTHGITPDLPFGAYNGSYITAFVSKWRKDIEQVLRDNNKYWTKIVALHEAVPGHHLQRLVTKSAKRSRMMPEFNTTVYVEGWGLYTEELMHMHGYFDNDPIEKLTLLRLRLWRCTRIVSDIGLQLGVLNDSDVIGVLTDCVRMEPVSAKAELNMYRQRPGYFCGYLLGYLHFIKLREECQNIAKDKFSEKKFHDKLLAMGPLPIKTIRKIMLRWAKQQLTY